MKYWCFKGKYQSVIDQLDLLVPREGSVPNKKTNPKLEQFRKTSNKYYKLMNDGVLSGLKPYVGDVNKWKFDYEQEYRNEIYSRFDEYIDRIVLEVCAEQGICIL